MKNKQTSLYRHYDQDGTLLYVGISLNALNRLSQHQISGWASDIAKVYIENFENRIVALEAEEKAIKKENPKFNIIHNKKNITILKEKNDAVYQCLNNQCDITGYILAPSILRKNPPICINCGEPIKFNFMWEKTMIKDYIEFVFKNNVLLKTKYKFT